MQSILRNIEMVLSLLIIFLLISACGTSGVNKDVITGKDWHHPNKTKQEQRQDYLDCRNECEKSVRAKGHSGPFAELYLGDCEDGCMQSKGYEWH